MAAEKRRACGYRSIGGTYLEAGSEGFGCGRLPLPLVPCMMCNQVQPFTRGLQRISPMEILHAARECASPREHCAICPLNDALNTATAGLMWVGEKFYTPESFTAEARELGVSKRIPWPIPKWLEIGKTWVFVAHPAATTRPCRECEGKGHVLVDQQGEVLEGAIQEPMFDKLEEKCEECEGSGREPAPAVFTAFIPRRVVRMIADTMPAEEREKLRKQGLELVELPHDDPDHAPKKRRQTEE